MDTHTGDRNEPCPYTVSSLPKVWTSIWGDSWVRDLNSIPRCISKPGRLSSQHWGSGDSQIPGSRACYPSSLACLESSTSVKDSVQNQEEQMHLKNDISRVSSGLHTHMHVHTLTCTHEHAHTQTVTRNLSCLTLELHIIIYQTHIPYFWSPVRDQRRVPAIATNLSSKFCYCPPLPRHVLPWGLKA